LNLQPPAFRLLPNINTPSAWRRLTPEKLIYRKSHCLFLGVGCRKIHCYIADYPDNQQYGCDIENRKIRFLLTGSSARKLRRGQANLLAGRVWEARLFPLTWKEAPGFNLEKYLRYGGLPAVYLSEYPEEELDAYVNTYLKEEIMAKALNSSSVWRSGHT